MNRILRFTKVIFLTLFSFCSQAQNVPLYQAEERDYVIITGKIFVVLKDDGKEEHWRRINDFFYVDRVDRDSDSVLKAVHLTDGKEVQFSIGFDADRANSYDELSRNASIMVCDTCDPKGYYVAYTCNDSLSMGSTHPSRPFLYGFNYTNEQCKQFLPDIDFMELKEGQNVASIGAATGWYEGALSVNTDGIHYMIEDVNPKFLNQKQFDAVVKHFSSVKEGGQTNTFDFVLGNYDSTRLPEKKFDKIIVRNAYHEFTGKWKMLHDLKSKLAPGGSLLLMDESFSSLYYTNYHSGCNIRALQAKEVIRFFGEQGLYIVKMDLPMNSLDNNLMFSADKKKSKEYRNSLKSMDEIFFKVDRLNTSFYAGDENYIEDVQQLLKDHLNEIHTVYDSLSDYITDIAGNWTEKENYGYALPILNMSDVLYPNIAYTQFYLGITYYGLEDRLKGDEYFARTIALDKTREKDIEGFKKWWGE